MWATGPRARSKSLAMVDLKVEETSTCKEKEKKSHKKKRTQKGIMKHQTA